MYQENYKQKIYSYLYKKTMKLYYVNGKWISQTKVCDLLRISSTMFSRHIIKVPSNTKEEEIVPTLKQILERESVRRIRTKRTTISSLKSLKKEKKNKEPKIKKPKELKVKTKRTKGTQSFDLGDLYGEELNKRINYRLKQYEKMDLKRGFESDFDLDIDWFKKNILWKQCIYCGSWNFIGCDRIDNKKGHSKNNCVPCCRDCNRIRGNYFTMEEMKILGKTIRKIIDSRKNK